MSKSGKVRAIFNLTGSAVGAADAVSQVRRARRERDTLALVNAVANVAAVITAVLLAVRTLRKGDHS